MENNRERERMDCEVIEKSWKKYESWMIGRAKSEERIPMNLSFFFELLFLENESWLF